MRSDEQVEPGYVVNFYYPKCESPTSGVVIHADRITGLYEIVLIDSEARLTEKRVTVTKGRIESIDVLFQLSALDRNMLQEWTDGWRRRWSYRSETDDAGL